MDTDRQNYFEIIEKLPQFDVLHADNFTRWLKQAEQFYSPDHIIWLIGRQAGIGGSEVGNIVASDFNAFSFSNSHEIAQNKLFLRFDPPTSDTQRGNAMEEIIRPAFYSKTGCERATDIYEHLTTVGPKGPIPGYEFLRGNVDDVIRFNGKNYIVDYKAPFKSPSDYIKSPPFNYVAQLNTYGTFAKVEKCPIDGLLLVAWDYKQWNPVIVPIKFDGQLVDRILLRSEDLWKNSILKGKIPKIDVRSHPIDISHQPHIHSAMSEFALADIIEKRCSERKKQLHKLVSDDLQTKAIKDGSSTQRGLSVIKNKIITDFDKVGLEDYAKSMNVDVESFRKPGSIDFDKLATRLKEVAAKAEHDIAHLFKPTNKVSMYVSRSKKSDINEMKATVNHKIDVSFNQLTNDIDLINTLAQSPLPPQPKKRKAKAPSP